MIGTQHRLLLLTLCLFWSEAALAERRVALVIGNAAYQHAPALKNTRNDAEAMAAALKQLGFEIVLGVDLDEAGMRRQLQDFAKRFDQAGVALVFYAGHGLQVHGRNYLVPVDAKLETETDLSFQAMELERIQRLLESSQRTSILILDSCRDNPLARNLARAMGTRSTAIGRGLAVGQSGLGTLIVYATQPDNVALDGEKRHSPFTEALLAHIATPGLEARQMLTRVRASVIKATNNRQVPWVTESMTGDFYFVAAPEKQPQDRPPAPAPDNEAVFWQSIRDSQNAADFKAYLARWPQGVFAELARLRIAQLERKIAAPAPRAAPRRAGTVFRDCSDCPELVVVPPGDFLMGSPHEEKDRFADEGPQHRVTIVAPFALGKYEVTRAEFQHFAAETGLAPKPCRVWRPVTNNFALDRGANWEKPGFDQSEHHPVVCVSWGEAKAYADWLTKKTAKPYRLPSEAEWEYAARAGTRSAFTWGSEPAGGCAYANGADQAYVRANRGAQASMCDDSFAATAPVGSFRANSFGLHDLIGNASEWTADCWHESFAGAPTDGKVWVSGACRQRSTRGGAWLAPPRLLRTAVRGGVDGEDRVNMLGFRVVRDLEAEER